MLDTNKLFNSCLLKASGYCSCSSSSVPRLQQVSSTLPLTEIQQKNKSEFEAVNQKEILCQKQYGIFQGLCNITSKL
jgi:hypothetical protein